MLQNIFLLLLNGTIGFDSGQVTAGGSCEGIEVVRVEFRRQDGHVTDGDEVTAKAVDECIFGCFGSDGDTVVAEVTDIAFKFVGIFIN